MSKDGDSTLLEHRPCLNPECGSSDAMGVYDDGHGFCFSCDMYFANVDDVDSEGDNESVGNESTGKGLIKGSIRELTKRGISEETCKKFNYRFGKLGDDNVQIANYCDNDGRVVAQKCRTANKDFKFIGKPKQATLFGQNLWRESGRMVVVTEGEIDAMSVSQAQGNKWPVVSVKNGASGAKRCLSEQLEWLEQFESVVLMFDDDEAGRKGVEECVGLFSPGKVKVAKIAGYKDANEALVDNKANLIIDAVWGAKTYKPDGVLDASELFEDVSKPIEWGLSYPWESITKKTYGFRPNELIVLGAGTGMGKTEVFKEMEKHCLIEHGLNVGVLHLEEMPKDTLLGIMSKQSDIPFHIPDASYTDDQLKQAFDAVTSDNRLYLYDSFGYTEWKIIKQRIRYLAISCGCQVIFLDHITALVSGSDGDERRELDNIMTDMASLVRELGITMFAISHLTTPEGTPHEEGGRVKIRHFRGSRAIGQWASFMFGLERNQQSSDPDEQSTTTFRILKDRFTGRSTGFTCELGYDSKTGRMFEKDDLDDFDMSDESEEMKEDF